METLRVLFPYGFFFDYVDDVLVKLPSSRAQLAATRAKDIHWAIKVLHLPLKRSKSVFTPTRKLNYLGFCLNTRSLSISVPPKKSRAVLKQVRKCLRTALKGRVSLSVLSSTVGKLMALLPACPEARLHTPFLYEMQNKMVQQRGWRNNAIHLGLRAVCELQWWVTFLSHRRERNLQSKYVCHELTVLATDASDMAIAGVLISDPKLPSFSRRLYRSEMNLPINVKEMIAVSDTIHHMSKMLVGTHINIRSDNRAVVSAINKWGSKSEGIRNRLKILFHWSLITDTKLSATYIKHTFKCSRRQAVQGHVDI